MLRNIRILFLLFTLSLLLCLGAQPASAQTSDPACASDSKDFTPWLDAFDSAQGEATAKVLIDGEPASADGYFALVDNGEVANSDYFLQITFVEDGYEDFIAVLVKDDVAAFYEGGWEVDHRDYAYEAAEASFELLARRILGQVPDFFDIEGFRVLVERRHNAIGELVTVSEAVVKVRVDGELLMSVGEGNGPVNALDQALRKDLGRYSAFLSDLELVDFKVRILNGGTGAVTRVLIESRDGTGHRWSTVGVSPNIVDASFQALHDSIIYKLLRDAAPAR